MSSLDRATLHPRGFNDGAALPYGLRVAEVKAALDDVSDLVPTGYYENDAVLRGDEGIEVKRLAIARVGKVTTWSPVGS